MGVPYVGPPPSGPNDIATKGVVDTSIATALIPYSPIKVVPQGGSSSGLPEGTVVLQEGTLALEPGSATFPGDLRYQVRSDTSAGWQNQNTLLKQGELGFDTNSKELKVGDGSSGWNTLISTKAQTTADAAFNKFGSFPRPLSDWGAKGDGTTNDSAAIIAAGNSGLPLQWGDASKIYAVSSMLTISAKADIYWVSSGAKIKVTGTASSLLRVVNINSGDYAVNINNLEIDANDLAHTAWYITSSTSLRQNLALRDVRARNVYRASTNLVGGDGIMVRGSYNRVVIDCPVVERVHMAAGAGVMGSQGISGITVSAAGPGLAPTSVEITSPWIDGVFSDDNTYKFDQDGIRVFTEEDSGSIVLYETTFHLTGGTIRNARGRAVKSQAEWGVVSNLKVTRNGTASGNSLLSGPGDMPEIDFQVGGGLVSNVEFQYISASPARIFNWSGTRQAGGKYSTGISVENIKVSITGGSSAFIDTFLTVSMYNQTRASINITNVEVTLLNNYIQTNFVNLNSGGSDVYTTQEVSVRVQNVTAPINTGQYVIYRNGLAMPTYGNVHNFTNLRPSASLYGSTNATAFNVNATGMNTRVA